MNSLIIQNLAFAFFSWGTAIGVGTFLSLLFLVGIIYWAWSPKRADLNRHAAESIFDDDRF